MWTSTFAKSPIIAWIKTQIDSLLNGAAASSFSTKNDIRDIAVYADGDRALCLANDYIYIFDDDNTTADNDNTYLTPADITEPAPGRWVKENVYSLSGHGHEDYIPVVSGATVGNLAEFDEKGHVIDSGLPTNMVITKKVTATEGYIPVFDANGDLAEEGIDPADLDPGSALDGKMDKLTDVEAGHVGAIPVINADGQLDKSTTILSDITDFMAEQELTTDELAAINGSATPSAANVFATMDDLPDDELTTDELAAINGAATPSAANVFATMDDLPDDELTTDELAAINGAATPSATNVFATMDDLPDDELTTDELAAINGAATPSAANVFATMDDLPDDELTADELAAINGAATPSAANVFATMDDLPDDELTSDELAAINGAATPSAANVFATMDDLPDDELTSDELAAINGAATPSAANVFATMDDLPTENIDSLFDLVPVSVSAGTPDTVTLDCDSLVQRIFTTDTIDDDVTLLLSNNTNVRIISYNFCITGTVIMTFGGSLNWISDHADWDDTGKTFTFEGTTDSMYEISILKVVHDSVIYYKIAFTNEQI